MGGIRFNKKKETFKNYFQLNSKQIGSSKNSVFDIYEDNNRNLWILHMYGSISIFNKETETFEHIKNTPTYINNFYEDKSGRSWITSGTGLYQYNRKSKTFQRYLYHPDDPDRLPDTWVVNIIEDDMNHFWINTYEGIYQYNQNIIPRNCCINSIICII
jgi:ligand-binding sensor domain-containing protein